ncbi:UbiA prenyltransferase family protein [Ulvibacter litoralis]|uniref:UbiA prenyltransferase family protein n=1 Tax=Ulvibacter litoralis TaxID=227084 RepID=A0A1G7C0T0_9FLAO|nr:UbiA prenyltransferase family protein [Ulvibacter litoralis]GHC49090.1 hypothetical protein GCM10008083_10680 [Ulvibacter litoralis]SDE32879.1 hypothetical protein SAMN05421855_101118 [Ulvibacter litoralis]
MNLLKRLFRFYINSSIHVALAVVALVGVTVMEYDLAIPYYLLGFVFFGTITGYNFVKYAEVAGLQHRNLTDSLKTIQVFSFFCFGILLFFLFHLSVHTLVMVGVFAMLTFFYAVPFLKHKNLRTFSGLKIFIVAVVWAGVTVFVPLAASKVELTTDDWLTFVQRFFIVVALILPFEIRDLRYDVTALKTLPQQIGIRKTKLFGVVLLMLCILVEGFKDVLSSNYLYSLLFVCLLIGVLLIASKKKQTRYFASFWVESVPIFWWGLFVVLESLF